MKKAIVVILVYTGLVFLFCLGLSFWGQEIPIIIPSRAGEYKFIRSISWLLELLPAVLFSGMTVACGLKWGKGEQFISRRFSQIMFDRLKIIMGISFGFALILSLQAELFSPMLQNKLHHMERGPLELNDSIVTAKKLVLDEEYSLAYQYALWATKIDPKSKLAQDTLKEVKDRIDIVRSQEFHKKRNTEEKREVLKPLHDRHSLYTPKELLEKSRKAAEEKNWFNAHYWAHLALEASKGTDTIYEDAEQASNYAWRQLAVPPEFDDDVERNYYLRKKSAYDALNEGDSLKAYYTFLELSKNPLRGERDPDVTRFLVLAKEDVENQYFFFDETDNMSSLASDHNIHFSLRTVNNSTYVFFIRHAMDVKKSGGMVRYLEGLEVIRYDQNMDFMYSFKVPYAKVVAQPVTEFDDDTLKSLGISKKWGAVPLVTLQSVDRDTEGVVSRPVYSYSQTQLPEEVLADNRLYYLGTDEIRTSGLESNSAFYERSSMLLLPMPFSDFHLINEASAGSEKMNLLALKKFIPKTLNYGFSKEVFSERFLQRTTFPLLILIISVFCASVGWNYRIDGKKVMFRFGWLLLVPVYGIIMYILVNCVFYLFSIINYVLIGTVGDFALIVAFIVYLAFLFGAMILFVSRKS